MASVAVVVVVAGTTIGGSLSGGIVVALSVLVVVVGVEELVVDVLACSRVVAELDGGRVDSTVARSDVAGALDVAVVPQAVRVITASVAAILVTPTGLHGIDRDRATSVTGACARSPTTRASGGFSPPWA